MTAATAATTTAATATDRRLLPPPLPLPLLLLPIATWLPYHAHVLFASRSQQLDVRSGGFLPQPAGQTWWKRSYCRQRLAMTANGWSNMVDDSEEELCTESHIDLRAWPSAVMTWTRF